MATGGAWAPAGTVLQVVQGTYATATTITTGTLTDTGLSATITPTSAASKILVIVSQPFYIQRASNGGIRATSALVRGSTVIDNIVGALGGSAATGISGVTNFVSVVNYAYLDSPVTTSSTTYKTQAAIQFSETSYYITTSQNLETATITLMEIAA
jgi:hypothetical protein